MPAFLRRLLTPEGMKAAHAGLIKRYTWFLHVGKIDRFEAYRQTGLVPHDPDIGGRGPPDLFREMRGPDGARIVCLRPIDSLDSRPTRGEQQFRMAVRNLDLPHTISTDWSYGGIAESLSERLQREHPDWSDADVFIEVAHRLGSFAVYDVIPPAAVRVCTTAGSVYNPATWRLLTEVDARDIEVVG